MLVDIQITTPQTAYKREQLSKSYRSTRKAGRSRTTGIGWWRAPLRKPSTA